MVSGRHIEVIVVKYEKSEKFSKFAKIEINVGIFNHALITLEIHTRKQKLQNYRVYYMKNYYKKHKKSWCS